MKIKSLVAAAVAVATVTAGVVIGIAAPASAHSLTLTGVASCVPSSSDGTVDWQLSNDYGTETSVTASDNASIPVGTTVPKNGSIHLTQSVAGPVNAGAYVSANLTLKWTDGFTQNVASGKVKLPSPQKKSTTASCGSTASRRKARRTSTALIWWLTCVKSVGWNGSVMPNSSSV